MDKVARRLKIKRRIRKNLAGTTQAPRLSVFRSNTAIYAQIIDDTKGVTLAQSNSKEIKAESRSVNMQLSAEVGKKIAEKALAAGVSKVVFDRNGYLYHGRVKALADAAREAGLKF